MSTDLPHQTSPRSRVRYAIVGLGDIAKDHLMPGVPRTDNSVITAFVTSDPEKTGALRERYGVDAVYRYEDFAQALASGTFDALYLATPNWRHAEFVVPALQAGIHVLCEKPLDVSAAKCQPIVEAARGASAKLMTAYRLHFEPATLATIDLVRSGRLGEVHTFTSNFVYRLDPANHRAKSGESGGPVLDLGTYPVNAARSVFAAEPIEVVSAAGTRHPDSGFDQDFDDTVAVTLRFPGNRLAQFHVGYYGGPLNTWTAIGSKGSVTLDPGYAFDVPLEQTVAIGSAKEHTTFLQTDHFAGEVQYFSRCILEGIEPGPNGEEGLADVRVLDAVFEALRTRGPVPVAPRDYPGCIDPTAQGINIPAGASV